MWKKTTSSYSSRSLFDNERIERYKYFVFESTFLTSHTMEGSISQESYRTFKMMIFQGSQHVRRITSCFDRIFQENWRIRRGDGNLGSREYRTFHQSLDLWGICCSISLQQSGTCFPNKKTLQRKGRYFGHEFIQLCQNCEGLDGQVSRKVLQCSSPRKNFGCRGSFRPNLPQTKTKL